MDAIQALLEEFKNNKIDDDQLQDQLASIVDDKLTSDTDLNQQVDALQHDYQLSHNICSSVKTIVADKIQSRANAKTVVANDNNATRVQIPENNDVTRVITETDRDNDKTVIHTTQNQPPNDPFATQVNTELDTNPNNTRQTINNAQTIVAAEHDTQREHTNNYFDRNTQSHRSIELKPGSILKNRFILEDELGHGGMSIVYRALDLRKQEANNRNPHIALKILGDAFKNHPQSIRVLEHETQKIQSLAHPNIITVYDFDRDGDAIYMTMECLKGRSLDVLIDEVETGTPIEKALPIIEGIGRALFYAHSKNIIHSDLKPENVFITNDKVVKVLDFGIARAKKIPEQSLDETGKSNADFDGSNLGALTPPYASPEMFEHADPDPRDDIYALGCLTYKLLTGEHPFKGMQANLARDTGLVPKKINELSRKQWATLSRTLTFKREERVATIAEFLDGMVPKKRTKWFYAGIAGTSIALMISAYSWYSASQKPNLPQISLSVEQKQQIKNYFETADLYLSMGYLASPPGDSAFDQYEKILEIDPTNQTAMEGKKRIARQYEVMASDKLKAGDLEESLLLVKTGLIVEPENEALLELQLKIHNKQVE